MTTALDPTLPLPSRPRTPRRGRRPRSHRGGVLAALGLVVALLAGACTDPEPITAPTTTAPAPPPAPETFDWVNFVPPDHRNVPLAPVPEGKPQPTPPVEVYGGEATIDGRLTFQGEPVSGATVQIERFVGLDSTTVQVSSRADGTFAATKVKGGRYRVRALLGDELTLPEAATFFLAEKERRSLALEMIEVPRTTKTVIRASSQPSNPPVGREVKLTFTVTNQTVAPDGTVESEAPVASRQLAVVEHEHWRFKGGKAGVTGEDGKVTFTATCEDEGTHEAVVEMGWITQTVALPACAVEGKPAPTEPEVGDELTVPTPGPIPAGTYVTDDPACVTEFTIWKGADWAGARGKARGTTMKLTDIAKDLQPGPGTLGCTYERTA